MRRTIGIVAFCVLAVALAACENPFGSNGSKAPATGPGFGTPDTLAGWWAQWPPAFDAGLDRFLATDGRLVTRSVTIAGGSVSGSMAGEGRHARSNEQRGKPYWISRFVISRVSTQDGVVRTMTLTPIWPEIPDVEPGSVFGEYRWVGADPPDFAD